MKAKFNEVFKTATPIMGMLHLKGETDQEVLERAKEEIEVYYKNHVDAVIVENYFGSEDQMELVLSYLKEQYPEKIYGVNCLDNDKKGFELARKYDAKFLQLDSVAGHLTPEEEKDFEQFIQEERKKTNALVFAGIWFKYQPYRSGRTLEEDLEIGITRCDAVVVTQDKTGQETSMDKIKQYRELIGEKPLIIGAGVTTENVREQFEVGDGAVVGSYFKDSYKDVGDVDASHVKTFMNRVMEVRKEND